MSQICINGDVITNSLNSRPEFGQLFCEKCGAKTIAECGECHRPIRGYANIPGVVSFSPPERPAYCHHCGKAFPWTSAALAAAREYTDELEQLTLEERAVLKDTFNDLASDTPRTPLAASRFRRFMSKVGPAAGAVLQKIVETVATEAAKKAAGF